MEHISSQQLKKYEDIINQIDSEFKRNELLKNEVDKEINKLVAVRIALEQNFTQENVFRVIVKIFSSIFEIFYLYSEEILKQEFEILAKLSNCKFYLIEVYISKLFQQKITNQNWYLNICVKNSKMCVCKNVPIQNDAQIFIIIPFDPSIEPATVTTNLFMNFNHFSSALRISTITLDVSYHFRSYHKPVTSPLLKLSENYIKLHKDLLKISILEYNFKCDCTTKHFFESIIKNCYHQIKPEIFTAFAEKSDKISLRFSISTEDEAVIKLDQTERILSIVCNIYDLHKIKNYFIEEIQCQRVTLDRKWRVGLMNMKHYLKGELEEPEVNVHNMRTIYLELRKLMYELVV